VTVHADMAPGIQRDLTLSGATFSSVVLDDSADAAGRMVLLDSAAVPGDSSPYGRVSGLGMGVVRIRSAGTGPVSILAGRGNDTFLIQNGFPLAPVFLDGGGGTNTLQGPDSPNTWQVTGTNGGSLNGTVGFASVQNLLGGAPDDTFAFFPGGT